MPSCNARRQKRSRGDALGQVCATAEPKTDRLTGAGGACSVVVLLEVDWDMITLLLSLPGCLVYRQVYGRIHFADCEQLRNRL